MVVDHCRGCGRANRPSAAAAPGVPSIAIKFGADEVNGLGGNSSVDSAAGVLNTATWNNTSLLNGGPVTLNRDLSGTSSVTTATVTWSSNNTWTSTGRGEENNSAAGENRDLMAGYLDTADVGGTPAIATVSGLNFAGSPFALGYDVLRLLARWSQWPRWDLYDWRDDHLPRSNRSVYRDVCGRYDPGHRYWSRRLFWQQLHDLPECQRRFLYPYCRTYFGAPARAAINGIEIVAVPEPVSVAAIAGGVALLLGWRRRRPM